MALLGVICEGEKTEYKFCIHNEPVMVMHTSDIAVAEDWLFKSLVHHYNKEISTVDDWKLLKSFIENNGKDPSRFPPSIVGLGVHWDRVGIVRTIITWFAIHIGTWYGCVCAIYI
jgi:hypothetical protein